MHTARGTANCGEYRLGATRRDPDEDKMKMIRPGTRLSRGVSHACASHLGCVCGSTRMFGWGCEIRVCARLCVRLAPWHVGRSRSSVSCRSVAPSARTVLGVTVSAPPGVFESVGILHSILHVDHSNARARAPNKTNHELFVLNGSAFTRTGTRLFHASFHVPKCPTKDSE